MALASGHSNSYSSYSTARYPIRISASTATRPSAVIVTKKRVSFASIADTLIPSVAIQFQIPYTTIDMFFRPETAVSLARSDTSPVYLVLDDVPASALPAIRLHVEGINPHAKIDYSATTKKLIISCASREHHYVANIGPDIMSLISSNDSDFTGNDPVYKIVENGDCGIPFGTEKYGRQPDGGLRLLNDESQPPFLIWEVLDSQPLAQMIEKISHYFSQSRGRIRIVIVIQLIRQPPPSKPKRKRRPSSIGDETEVKRPAPPLVTIPGEDTNNPDPRHDASEPVLPPLPPPGRLIEGYYWVYKHGLNAARKRVVQCPISREEFYPTPPTGSLTLTWADILRNTPPHLANKSLVIPFTILHDRFREIVGAATTRQWDTVDAGTDEEGWDFSTFPGIQGAEDGSDPVSEAVASDDDADRNFAGAAVPLLEGTALRRSARIANSDT